MYNRQIIICLYLILITAVLTLPIDTIGSQSSKVTSRPTSQQVTEASENFIAEPKRKTGGLSSIAYGCVQGVNLCKQASRRTSKVVHDIGSTIGPDQKLNRLRSQYDKLKLNIHKSDFKANKLAREEVQRARSIKRLKL